MATWLYGNPGYSGLSLGVSGNISVVTVTGGATLTPAVSSEAQVLHVSSSIQLPFTALNRPATWPDEGLVSDWEAEVTVYQVAEGFQISLPALKFSATGRIENTGILNAVFPKLRMSASGIISEVGSLVAAIPLLRFTGIGAIGETGSLAIRLPLLRLSFSAVENDVGTFAIAFPALRADFTGIVDESATFAVKLPMMKISFGIIHDYMNMVMNLKNKALTLYDNYDFKSLCRFNGKHFGATATAIYDLDTGSYDDGTVITWNYKTAYLDLHQKEKKRLKDIWFSYKSDGNIIVTVHTTDGHLYEYDLTAVDAYEDGIRVKVGKGIKNKYLAIDVKNDDGSTITLDRMKLMFEMLGRKR